MPPVRSLLIALLVLFAGCVGTAAPGGSAPGDTTTSPAPKTADCGDRLGVSFYGLTGPGSDNIWSNDSLTVGYRVPANVTLLFVAYVDGERAGADAVGPYEKPVTADGDRIEIGRELSGDHAVRVAVYRDANGNGAFDPGTDPACQRDGERVRTDRRTIDFDRFDDEGTDDDGTKTDGD